MENLKAENGSNPWPVIEECFKVWESTNPREWKSYLLDVEDERQNQKNPHGSSKLKSVRHIIDIPQKVMYMIRTLYSADELPMNQMFIRELARRFPRYRVAKKI